MKFLLIAPGWTKLPEQTNFNLPPLGPIQVAAAAPDDVEVRIVNENVQPVDLEADCDLVGLSVLLSCQAPRAYELAHEFRQRGKPVVLGGLHVTLCPEEAAGHADAVVLGEGEGLIGPMVADFRQGRPRKVYAHSDYPDIAKVPSPRRALYDKSAHYSYKGLEMVDLVETSRGCRFNCYPCCVPYLGGRRHRIKPWDLVAQDLASCSNLIFIVDNSLEQNKEYERSLCRNLAGLKKHWISHPITPDPELLGLARESGCWYVYHAIFDISDKIRDRIKLYHDHGIAVEGTVLLGLDNHTEDFILRLIDFLQEIELDLAEFTVLTPFPRTQAWKQLNDENRIFDRDWKNYNAATVVYRPRLMSPDKLQELYYRAWREFYGRESQSWRMTKLYLKVIRDLPRPRRKAGQAAGTAEPR
ncbi:MAG: radical SAM protein [Thermodesulfobacteriota bacterium]